MKISNEMVPTVKIGDSFCYLGKDFSFDMNLGSIKKNLTSLFDHYFEKLERLPLHPMNKIKIVNTYVYSKIKWFFMIYDVSETWVTNELDSIVKHFIKKWLHFHKGANVKHLYYPVTKFGLELKLPSDILKFSKLSKRNILKNSPNYEIKQLYLNTRNKFISQDNILNDKNGKPKSLLNNIISKNIDDHMGKLKEQNTIKKVMKQSCSGVIIKKWTNICEALPRDIFNFSRKALIYSLPTNANLYRWKKIENDLCKICHKSRQTQLHILNNCNVAAVSGRYLWRHNSVLYSLFYYISQLNNYGFKCYVDLNGFSNFSILFRSLRPYIVIKKAGKLFIIELTCCYETNCYKSREYKANKYKDIDKDCVNVFQEWNKIYVEVTSLGLVTKNIKFLKAIFKNTNINYDQMLGKAMEVALRCSYYVYIKRNDPWDNPEILTFH